MPIVRIDPPKRKGNSFFGGLKRLGAFAANPVGTLVQSVQDIHAPRDPATFYPTEFDTETGDVSILIPAKGKGLLGRNVTRLKPLADSLERQLEQSIRAGSVVPSLTGAYRELAELLLVQAALFPNSTPTTPGQYDMAGIIPPGGFAGFAQMTPASKLALGARMTKRKKKSRKARKAKKSAKRKVAKRTKKASRGKKFVKGSAAAKAHMKRLRNLRK